MKMIIDISEETYKEICRHGLALCPRDSENLIKAIKKGAPLEECEDCISRQAAIDAVKGWETVPVKVLEMLPPVTPQYTDAEIQKMQDLEFAEIQKAYEIGKAENPNKWIPVSERLPEKPDMYTVTDSKGDVVRFVFNDTESSRKYWLRCAKAWMPLPEPYKASPTGEEVQDADCD